MPFAEVRLGVGYDRGSVGGPLYSTQVTTAESGREYRTRRWQESRGSWEIGNRAVPGDVLDELQAFFRARGGRADGFRFKDYSDFTATDETLTLTGEPTVQLTKAYADAGGSYLRNIYKPVAGATFKRAGATYPGAVVDTTTGVVSLSADVSQTPTAVAAGSPTTLTVPDASLWSVGDVAWLVAPGQTPQAAAVTAVDTGANTVTVAVDSTGWGWSGGTGSVNKYPQPAEAFTWSGEFDVPVRFDTDNLRSQLVDAPVDGIGPRSEYVFMLQSVPVVEIRL